MDQLSSLTLFDIIFYFFAFITIVSAAIVVFSRNIIHSAFSLMFTFFGVAGLYVMLNADFIAVTQVLIYVGGILVLILFGVMLTTKVIGVEMKTGTLRVLPASILGCRSCRERYAAFFGSPTGRLRQGRTLRSRRQPLSASAER